MKKILVIDDSSEVTTLIKHLMKDHAGVEVVSFNDEFEALKNINSINPDLILLDVYLNVTDGLKLKSFIDALSPTKIPVLFMSTYETAPLIMSEELPAREQLFLPKPIMKKDLRYFIHSILKEDVVA